ncbi:hypothetical protein ABVK25_001609 [Lepraria finkii]|uniref:Uncharacterized protein n=1 Tax=Lepraria finkii TaxID=1340010 RepID=A0ABR4BKR8_9LECA
MYLSELACMGGLFAFVLADHRPAVLPRVHARQYYGYSFPGFPLLPEQTNTSADPSLLSQSALSTGVPRGTAPHSLNQVGTNSAPFGNSSLSHSVLSTGIPSRTLLGTISPIGPTSAPFDPSSLSESALSTSVTSGTAPGTTSANPHSQLFRPYCQLQSWTIPLPFFSILSDSRWDYRHRYRDLLECYHERQPQQNLRSHYKWYHWQWHRHWHLPKCNILSLPHRKWNLRHRHRHSYLPERYLTSLPHRKRHISSRLLLPTVSILTSTFPIPHRFRHLSKRSERHGYGHHWHLHSCLSFSER